MYVFHVLLPPFMLLTVCCSGIIHKSSSFHHPSKLLFVMVVSCGNLHMLVHLVLRIRCHKLVLFPR